MVLELEDSQMPIFGSKKKKEQGADIEAPEEDGLFMARSSEAAASEAAPTPPEESGKVQI